MMTNKNKIIVNILEILLVFILLNSCGTTISQAEEETKQAHENIYVPNKNEEETLCPVCKKGQRYFYKLGNEYITLYCDECSSMWLNPNNIGEDGIASDEIMQQTFKGVAVTLLFNLKWATEKEVKESQWNTIKNPLLLWNNQTKDDKVLAN
jgi:hypothetical protein